MFLLPRKIPRDKEIIHVKKNVNDILRVYFRTACYLKQMIIKMESRQVNIDYKFKNTDSILYI